MKMNEVGDSPREEELSFYEDELVYESKTQRRLTPFKTLSAKKVSKRLFDLCSTMTVDLPVWNDREDISWENSSTESEQANIFTSFQTRGQFAAELPGYVLGLNLF